MIITKMTSAVVLSLIFIIGMAIIYFSKKRADNEENKIYRLLIAANIVGLILHLLCDVISYKYNVVPLYISTIIYKTFLIYYFAFGALLLSYLIIIANLKHKDLYQKILLIVAIALYITVFFIPQNVYRDVENMIFYTNGPDVQFMYTVCAIETTLLFIIIIFKINKIDRKKALPLFLFVFGVTIAIIIQHWSPDLVVTDCIESILVLLMYFTIENPDLKMIEQLNIARDQADKANQAKSDFLSSMSHEIRTPLNAIVGFSEALQEEELPEKAREEVKDIVMASNSLLEIVNGILDISKIESGKIEIVNSEYNFRDIYDNLVALTKGRLGEKPLEIRTSYDESIPKVLYGDHTRVKQIILNILTNAVKYTKEGYIDFRVTSLVKDDICRLIISVEDSGIGIKQENINKLFSRFERLDIDKNITIEGTGLGLAITKKLIELMQGTIVVQSVYGKGSKFTIAIDQRIIHKEIVEDAKVEVVDSSKNVDVSGKKVLIVDDNKINLKVASRLLESYNLNIETLDSGASCLDKINSGNIYDLILMDDMMPGMSGVETLHKLKENTSFNIPIVALTANAISGMKEKYLSEGFNDYLAKPIDKEELKKIIIKYLNK